MEDFRTSGKRQKKKQLCRRSRFNKYFGWSWWLTPEIPELWEAKAGGSLEARSLRPSWATQQDLISIIKK